jgi:hypothetical protein
MNLAMMDTRKDWPEKQRDNRSAFLAVLEVRPQ